MITVQPAGGALTETWAVQWTVDGIARSFEPFGEAQTIPTASTDPCDGHLYDATIAFAASTGGANVDAADLATKGSCNPADNTTSAVDVQVATDPTAPDTNVIISFKYSKWPGPGVPKVSRVSINTNSDVPVANVVPLPAVPPATSCAFSLNVPATYPFVNSEGIPFAIGIDNDYQGTIKTTMSATANITWPLPAPPKSAVDRTGF
jgi:hypothetical protein